MKLPTGPILARPDAANDYHDTYVRQVAQCFARVTGGDLAAEAGIGGDALGREVWFGNFALLTHRGDARASLNYANACALNLWEMVWEDMAGLPSSVTAPPDDIADREALLGSVARDKFVRGYGGRRISAKGRLFRIENVTVWRLLDQSGQPFGVGAFFKNWR